MIKNIERAKDGVDSMIDRDLDAVVGVADRAERGVESAAGWAVDSAHVASEYVRDGVETASRGARQRLESTAKAVDLGYREAWRHGSRAATAATDYVTHNPGRSLLLVASAGFVLGMLMCLLGVWRPCWGWPWRSRFRRQAPNSSWSSPTMPAWSTSCA